MRHLNLHVQVIKISIQNYAILATDHYNPPINFCAILLATLRHVVQIHRTVITQ